MGTRSHGGPRRARVLQVVLNKQALAIVHITSLGIQIYIKFELGPPHLIRTSKGAWLVVGASNTSGPKLV